MEGSNVSCQKWVIAIYLISTNLKGVSSMKLHQLNDVIGQMGDFGDGLILRFAVVVAIAVSDQDSGIGFAALFGLDDRDMHGGGVACHG